jgi:hypothetical protein
MTWTRLGDDFNDRPGIIGLSDAAFRAHVEALVWANQQTTDGRLPGGIRELRRILSAEDLAAVVTELTKAGLWEAAGEEYQLDWSEQESSDRVRERKTFNADRQRRFRDRAERHARGDHSACDPRFCKGAGNASRNESDDASVTATRPVPSRPLGRDRDRGRAKGAARSAGAPRPAYRAPQEELLRALREGDDEAVAVTMQVNCHEWRDDGSGTSCKTCGLEEQHLFHSTSPSTVESVGGSTGGRSRAEQNRPRGFTFTMPNIEEA